MLKRSVFWLLDHHPEAGETVAEGHHAALEAAALADRLGFSSLWLAEHHGAEPAGQLGTVPHPAVLLAAMAQRTERIRLGPAVAVLPLRDPVQVVEDYGVVDGLSRGRLNLGVGSGSRAEEFALFGADFEHRRQIFAERLAEVRARWVAMRPSSKPPIYVSTMHEDSAYRIGADGDSLLTLVPPSVGGLEAAVARVHAHARGLREAGHRETGAESVVMMFAHAAETASQVRATVVPALARVLRLMGGVTLPDPEGFYAQLCASGAGLFGTPDAVEAQLDQLAERGVEHVAFISRFGGMSRGRAEQSLQRLAPPGRGTP